MRVTSPTRSVGLLSTLSTLVATIALAAPAHAATPQAPGTYSGKGFDICQAPDQRTMDAWLKSPFRAIGIYVSGNSRYCGDAYQPNLTPAWVQTNAARGWHFIPIHVGYQSPCFKNNPNSRVQKKHMSSDAGKARAQARSDAAETIRALRRLGFPAGSTSYLDLEWYKRTASCDNVTLEFMDAWTETLHASGFHSGVYSSGSAAIKAMDDALRARRRGFTPPDNAWIAWTNGAANTDGGPYLSPGYFNAHQRIHQYKNGSRQTFGGRTLTIDWNYLDVRMQRAPTVKPAPNRSARVAALAKGSTPKLKRGSSGEAVGRLQRALTATGRELRATGHFGSKTEKAVKSYRKANGLRPGKKVTKKFWAVLQSGAAA